jgi:hypothetical protein
MNRNSQQFCSEEREGCEKSNESEPRSHSSFIPNQNLKARNAIKNRLYALPQVGVGPGFDQKMAALFAMELELETKLRSASFQLKNNKIRLPDIITDFRKEFL